MLDVLKNCHLIQFDHRPRHRTYNRILYFLLTILLPIFMITRIHGSEDYTLELETEGRYHIQPGVSDELTDQIALYDAKRKAVELAARYLARRNLIEPLGRDREEIFSLATRKINISILEKRRQAGKGEDILFIRINAWIRPSDFVAAVILDQKIDKEEEKKSFLQEMEPSISKEIDPGKDIAEAYRMIDENQYRMAVIYLDRLEAKYPGWYEIHKVKALGYYALNDTANFSASLKKACRLGDEHACQEVKSFKKIHNRSLNH